MSENKTQGKYILEYRCKTLGYKDRTLCSDIDLKAGHGDCILLCGANGSGKSTLLRELAGQKGCCLIPGGIPKVKGFTVHDFIASSFYRESSWYGRINEDIKARIDESLARLGINHLRNSDISRISDGEFQKACIAAGLCNGSEILMFDEPCAFLDAENRIMVYRIFRELSDEGRCIIFSSHDLADATRYCNRVWAIGKDGKMHTGSGESIKESVNCIFSENVYL